MELVTPGLIQHGFSVARDLIPCLVGLLLLLLLPPLQAQPEGLPEASPFGELGGDEPVGVENKCRKESAVTWLPPQFRAARLAACKASPSKPSTASCTARSPTAMLLLLPIRPSLAKNSSTPPSLRCTHLISSARIPRLLFSKERGALRVTSLRYAKSSRVTRPIPCESRPRNSNRAFPQKPSFRTPTSKSSIASQYWRVSSMNSQAFSKSKPMVCQSTSAKASRFSDSVPPSSENSRGRGSSLGLNELQMLRACVATPSCRQACVKSTNATRPELRMSRSSRQARSKAPRCCTNTFTKRLTAELVCAAASEALKALTRASKF
mmetsp:Transcript_99960/g.198306  ORF Transcript_99960/g.198306 Transcript_99960/m.198306 type:complete len:323 (+) Transcript_99960:616-1584(+)